MTRVVALGLWLFAAAIAAAQGHEAASPVISIRQGDGGAYTVSARFVVSQPAVAVQRVLTDYEQIPRFMPGVRVSRVLERAQGQARIEQEAVAKFMMFSKRVHLVLDIEEEAGAIRFRDRCGKSFAAYIGTWTLAERGDHTEIEYQLDAKPAFGVPGFILRQLLDRDARAMIEGLRAEMHARAMAR